MHVQIHVHVYKLCGYSEVRRIFSSGCMLSVHLVEPPLGILRLYRIVACVLQRRTPLSAAAAAMQDPASAKTRKATREAASSRLPTSCIRAAPCPAKRRGADAAVSTSRSANAVTKAGGSCDVACNQHVPKYRLYLRSAGHCEPISDKLSNVIGRFINILVHTIAWYFPRRRHKEGSSAWGLHSGNLEKIRSVESQDAVSEAGPGT
jgi:hypothetical protein